MTEARLRDTVLPVTSVQPPLWSHGLDTHRMCLVSVPGTRHIVIIPAGPWEHSPPLCNDNNNPDTGNNEQTLKGRESQQSEENGN